jgi:hypothetical protein
MEPVHILRIIVASPGDVQAERDALPAVLEELNRGIAAEYRLRLELGRWETDAYPGFDAQGPQGLIDPILRIEDCDVLLGIFWSEPSICTVYPRRSPLTVCPEHERKFVVLCLRWE